MFDYLDGVYTISFSGNTGPSCRINLTVESTEGYGEAVYDIRPSKGSGQNNESLDPGMFPSQATWRDASQGPINILELTRISS